MTKPAERSPSEVQAALLRELAAQGPIRMPVALVVAHQDDEMIAAGGTMARFLDLTLIHVTDGATEDGEEARAMGFADRGAYAAARRREVDAALRAACAQPTRRVCYGIPDQRVAARMEAVVERLTADFMTVDAVITHAYEGGHMDHDACALACERAMARLAAMTGRRLGCLEFAGYYHVGGYVRTAAFWADPAHPAVTIDLSETAVRRRDAALRCFATQAGNMGFFGTLREAFRARPAYDFALPSPPMREGAIAPGA
ncbi:MAG: PIG-L family deacetylase [Proteobacteria bacterium]|nr:PIG-L family deacetylase [Pseudomonadota bacterium]